MKFFEAYTNTLRAFNENGATSPNAKYIFQNLFSLNSTIEIWDNGQVYAMY